jgi:ATP-dependent Clp protease ATP-binding subunit ClpA
MHQFLNGNEASFRDLEERARVSCVVFQNQEMPPGTSPRQRRVGFEIQSDETAILLVDTGATYRGNCDEVRDWLAAGEKRFTDFIELRSWLESTLKPCYENGSQNIAMAQTASRPRIETLTDYSAVRLATDNNDFVKIDAESVFHKLSAQIRGQDVALQRLSRRVCQHFARLASRRPATVFAVGPTGVGKTQTAELLPEVLRQTAGTAMDFHYLRLDMSEYQESHRISQLLGAPQGYIGYGDGAQLLDILAAHPKTIVLFDEIEKAHPNILRALMNAMDAGRLSSATRTGNGRQVDCREAVFLFTSNLSSEGIIEKLERRNGFDDSALVDEVCRSHLKKAGIAPEMIGRIGCFLVYQPLGEKTQMEVCALSVVRVAAEYGVQVVKIRPETLSAVIKQLGGNDYGARPSEHLIDDLLGAAFIERAREFNNDPVEVCGETEFTCVPVTGNYD